MTQIDETRERQTAYFNSLVDQGVPDTLACEVAQILATDTTPLNRLPHEEALVKQAYEYIMQQPLKHS